MARLLVASLAGLIPLVDALKTHVVQKGNNKDLVLMHVPYNFGHTVELARLLPKPMMDTLLSGISEGFHGGISSPIAKFATGSLIDDSMLAAIQMIKPDSEAWGRFRPDLNEVSEVTGCGLYFTPQKYWPEEIAKTYFGNKTVFGLLRDPYERLIAFFRGGFDGYGGSFPEFFKTCDVNSAIKAMMNRALNSTDPFIDGCTYLPQAEYFEGPYGITLPIDNRRFPASMNEAFAEHGYSEHIKTESILHVSGCNDIWAGDLDAEAKRLVRKVYARDFELLCKHFGYCDDEESVCLQGVMHMCPEKMFHWDATMMQYVRNL